MGRLTKAEIVSTALAIVGNKQIQATGEGWLDILLDEIARTVRWPDLQRQYSITIAPNQDTLAYPLDYAFLVPDRRSRAVGIYSPNDGSGATNLYLSSLGMSRDSASHQNTVGASSPMRIADDRDNRQWVIDPKPSLGGLLAINYQYIPAPVASGAVCWFPSDRALMDAIAFMAEVRGRGGQVNIQAALQTASMRRALGGPARAQLW